MSDGASYQATVFHRQWAPKIVTSHEAYEAALADGWADTPAAFYGPPLVPTVMSAPEPEPTIPDAPVDVIPAVDKPRRGRRPRADRNSHPH